MATITTRKNKDGDIISYVIRVYRGYDTNGKRLKPYTMTYKPDSKLTPKQVEKELNKRAMKFEEQCTLGYALDNKQTFAQYADYVIELKQQGGVKHSTIMFYKGLLKRINQGIGHIKISDLRPQHFNMLYAQLAKNGLRDIPGTATAKVDLAAMLKERELMQVDVAKKAEVAVNTLANAIHGKRVAENIAHSIAAALGEDTEKLFDIERDLTPLSNKTILEHHRLISTILAQAEKEMIIPYNPAAKATPPKAVAKEADYLEIEDIERIRDCLES